MHRRQRYFNNVITVEPRFLEPNKKVLGEIGSSIAKYRSAITVKHPEAKCILAREIGGFGVLRFGDVGISP